MTAYRTALRFLGLDAHPDRPETLGSPWDLAWFLVGLGVIVGLLAVRG